MTLQSIAEDLQQHGRYGPRAQRAGEWKWSPYLRQHLEIYLRDLGVDVSNRLNDSEQERVWENMKNDIEWIAEHLECYCPQ